MAGPSQYTRLDPRLESSGLWQDFHASFIITLREWLTRHLGPAYIALVEERVYVTWQGGDVETLHRPDVSVSRVERLRGRHSTATVEPAQAGAPITVAVALRDEVKERSVSIRTLEGELVTSLELLSPSNKRSGHEGRSSYLEKRQQLLTAGVHLVEMDFVLQGERMPPAVPWPPCERSVLVVRRHRAHAGELYAFSTSDPLPVIRMPVRSPDPDLKLDLQVVLEETWARAGYDRILQHLRAR